MIDPRSTTSISTITFKGFCPLCGIQGHAMIDCKEFKGNEIAIFCNATETIAVMCHPNWPEATIMDVKTFFYNIFGLRPQFFYFFNNNLRIEIEGTTDRCIDLNILAGNTLLAVCRPDAPTLSPKKYTRNSKFEACCKCLLKHAHDLCAAALAAMNNKDDDDDDDTATLRKEKKKRTRQRGCREKKAEAKAEEKVDAPTERPDVKDLLQIPPDSSPVGPRMDPVRSDEREVPQQAQHQQKRKSKKREKKEGGTTKRPDCDERTATAADEQHHKPPPTQSSFSRTIYIRHIPCDMSNKVLRELLNTCGNVLKVRRCDKDGKRQPPPHSSSKNFAPFDFCFVEYETEDEVNCALRKFRGMHIDWNHKLCVQMSKNCITGDGPHDAAVAADHYRPCTFGGVPSSSAFSSFAQSTSKQQQETAPQKSSKSMIETMLSSAKTASSSLATIPLGASFNKVDSEGKGGGGGRDQHHHRHNTSSSAASFSTVHDSPSTSNYSENYEEMQHIADCSAREFIANQNDETYHRAKTDALHALKYSKRAPVNRARAAVLLIALATHVHQYDEAASYSEEYASGGGFTQMDGYDARSKISFLDNVLTIGLLVELFNSQIADLIFDNISLCAKRVKLVCRLPVRRPNQRMIECVLPGVSAITTGLLSGMTHVCHFLLA